MNSRERYAPHLSLPAYTYVPNREPHPMSDPQGHSYGRPMRAPPAPDPNNWHDCERYLFAVDLFNAGYYWEAHEAWESLWLACGRKGTLATFFKGLIKLAAAGVKHAQDMPKGVRGHCVRAAELFVQVESPKLMGLQLDWLKVKALGLAESWEPLQLSLESCVLNPLPASKFEP